MDPHTDSGLSAQHRDFIAELRRWRDVAGFSQKALAKKIGYDSSYVSKVERGSISASNRDAFKELWLLFENQDVRFPLYPEQTAWIEYRYHVAAHKWGAWWQRAIRLPTRRLQMRLDLPTNHDPSVWGTETSMSADASTFRNPIMRQDVDDRAIFIWSTQDPPLHARYRLQWKFRNQHPERPVTATATPSERMAAAGIVQEGEPSLLEPTREFGLPDEAEDVRRIVAGLASAMSRAVQAHAFTKGVGLAAPQIGIGRAVALIETPDGQRITLINPKVIGTSAETDEQYEGCLSFFDVRGMVPRPLTIEVEHQDIEGNIFITEFRDGDARLVCHEIDHLNGILYRDRMRPGVQPIPVSQYRGGGQNWQYPGS